MASFQSIVAFFAILACVMLCHAAEEEAVREKKHIYGGLITPYAAPIAPLHPIAPVAPLLPTFRAPYTTFGPGPFGAHFGGPIAGPYSGAFAGPYAAPYAYKSHAFLPHAAPHWY